VLYVVVFFFSCLIIFPVSFLSQHSYILPLCVFVGLHMTVLHTLLGATLSIKPLIDELISLRSYRRIWASCTRRRKVATGRRVRCSCLSRLLHEWRTKSSELLFAFRRRLDICVDTDLSSGSRCSVYLVRKWNSAYVSEICDTTR